MFSSVKRPCHSPSSPPSKRLRQSDPSSLGYQGRSRFNALNPCSFHSGPVDPIRMQRAFALFSDASNNVANSYIIPNPSHSSSHHPSMSSSSRRFSPYPSHKPSKTHSSSRSSLSCLTNFDFDTSVFGIMDQFEPSYVSPYDQDLSVSSLWGHLSYAPQCSAQPCSPYSDDSAIATPVSEHSSQHLLIEGDDLSPEYGVAASYWRTLYTQDGKQLSQSFELQETPQNVPSADVSGVPAGYETLQETYYTLSPSQCDILPTSSPNPKSCSFATTSPQYVSPFHDSAVTSNPQPYPLFAPKPVRPIPKVCFTPPEEDTLPTTSLLYKPVSHSVKQGRLTNTWTRS